MVNRNNELLTLSEDQRTTLVNCLYVAADRFSDDAKLLRAGGPGTFGVEANKRLAEQFEKQEKDSRALGDLIQCAEQITVEIEPQPDELDAEIEEYASEGAIWDGKSVAGGTFERGE
jgi:hypothetical protein